jgi:hypothetical protein
MGGGEPPIKVSAMYEVRSTGYSVQLPTSNIDLTGVDRVRLLSV